MSTLSSLLARLAVEYRSLHNERISAKNRVQTEESKYMKIFITGHKGNLGSEFTKRYGGTYEIVGYDLKDGEDLLDYERVLEKMRGCEQVVHLAAIPGPFVG